LFDEKFELFYVVVAAVGCPLFLWQNDAINGQKNAKQCTLFEII